MIKNEKKLSQLVEKYFGINHKENKHVLGAIAKILTEMPADFKKITKETKAHVIKLLGLNPNSKVDLQKVDDFIKIIINS